MKLRQQHVAVLAAMRRFSVPVDIASIQAVAIHSMSTLGVERFYTQQRVYAILDELETEGMVRSARMGNMGGAIWALSQKGKQCLMAIHH
jgi:hypothetical protein